MYLGNADLKALAHVDRLDHMRHMRRKGNHLALVSCDKSQRRQKDRCHLILRDRWARFKYTKKSEAPLVDAERLYWTHSTTSILAEFRFSMASIAIQNGLRAIAQPIGPGCDSQNCFSRPGRGGLFTEALGECGSF
jgi:hypothetical protein